MNTVMQQKTMLEERLEKIERQNKRLKSGMTLLILPIVGMVLLGASAGLTDGHFRQITAQSISVVDASGQQVVFIGSNMEGTGIRIFNGAGQRVVGLGSTSDDGESGIVIADRNGKPRIGMGVDEGVPSLAVVNEAGRKIVAMGGDNRGYGFVVMDENETERAGLGFKDGSAGVAIYDNKGQYVRGMLQQSDGVHYTSYRDDVGNEIIER